MINNVTLMGRLVADPELRTTTTGKSVANFRIAVDRSYSKGDNKQTDFITICCWEGQANFVEKWFKKGDMIALQGSIQTRNFEDKDGNKRTAFEVLAREVSFCGGKNETSPAPAQAPATPAYSIPDDFEEIDTDLPF